MSIQQESSKESREEEGCGWWEVGVVVVTLISEHPKQQKLITSMTLFFKYVFNVTPVFWFQFLRENSFQCSTCLVIVKLLALMWIFFLVSHLFCWIQYFPLCYLPAVSSLSIICGDYFSTILTDVQMDEGPLSGHLKTCKILWKYLKLWYIVTCGQNMNNFSQRARSFSCPRCWIFLSVLKQLSVFQIVPLNV